VLRDAQRDLDEALSIANQDGMDLHQAACHLEYARLYAAMGDGEKAQRSLDVARTLIEKTSYHRRDGDVQQIGASLSR
jgi:hypothetical protein